MFATRLARPVRSTVSSRQFSLTSLKGDGKSTKIESTQTQASSKQTGTDTQEILGSHNHTVTPFDKRLLVWVKRYPSVAEVPEVVTSECILTARSKARIKTCNYLIVFTVVGFMYAAYAGKRDLAAGLTIHKQGEDRHKRIREQTEAERMAHESAKA